MTYTLHVESALSLHQEFPLTSSFLGLERIRHEHTSDLPPTSPFSGIAHPFCLPTVASLELSCIPKAHSTNHWILPIQSLRLGQRQRVLDSSHHSLSLIKLINSKYPEGNFGRNQLLYVSISLSLLYRGEDLHIRIAMVLHQPRYEPA